tara:strand:- start:252 stop:866 length:615 start_codon:yes stop_codon:yes gene_type:complete
MNNIRGKQDLLEAVLLSSEEPLSINQIKKIFDDHNEHLTIKNLLHEIQKSWEGKMIELVQVASGWRFQANMEVQNTIKTIKPQKPPSYSRAVMETLAIIAYKQPVTRGDIEDIRSVSVSANIIRLLEARGWIETVGFKETPGRPALIATTKNFLDDLGLKGLDQLPPLEDVGELIDDLGKDLEAPRITNPKKTTDGSGEEKNIE